MYVNRPDAKIFYQVAGGGERDLFLLPPCQVVTHSRMWKHQVPYLSRYFRVITMDQRGNGRSDRPATGYDLDRMADHTRAVLDAAGVERAALVCFSRGAWAGAILASRHAERVERVVLTGSALSDESRPDDNFFMLRDRYEGWEKYNTHYWRTHFRDFLEFFMSQMFTEPHSTKPREDAVSWGLGTTPEVLIASTLERGCRSSAADLFAGVRVPTLIIHGTADKTVPIAASSRVAAQGIAHSTLIEYDGAPHGLFATDKERLSGDLLSFLARAG